MKKLPITEKEKIEFTELVKKIKFFAHINIGTMEKILGYLELYEYKKGEKICKQGEPGNSFYVVRKGSLNVLIKKFFFMPSKKNSQFSTGRLLRRNSSFRNASQNSNYKMRHRFRSIYASC